MRVIGNKTSRIAHDRGSSIENIRRLMFLGFWLLATRGNAGESGTRKLSIFVDSWSQYPEP
jgi:hypothetical protein